MAPKLPIEKDLELATRYIDVCYTTCQGENSDMATSAMKELRVCVSLIRQCCSNWKGFPQSNVNKSAAVVSGIIKCVLGALIYNFIK